MYRESSFRDFLDFLPTNVKTYRRFVQTLKIDTAAYKDEERIGSATLRHS
jgi:hypothetical protein